jgi:hypothetical protein
MLPCFYQANAQRGGLQFVKSFLHRDDEESGCVLMPNHEGAMFRPQSLKMKVLFSHDETRALGVFTTSK